MKYKIVSLYKSGLNPQVIECQKKVFNKFNIPFIQVEFDTNHCSGIEKCLACNDWDLISIIDIDLIPLDKDVFNITKDIISSKPVIYGNAQSSNSSAYIAPSFLNFSKHTYRMVNYSSFSGGFFNDKETDVAEMFSLKAKEKNIELQFSLPNKIIEPLWKCRTGIVHFDFGIGTYYDNNTFHCFEIRKSERQNIFLNKCREILDS